MRQRKSNSPFSRPAVFSSRNSTEDRWGDLTRAVFDVADAEQAVSSFEPRTDRLSALPEDVLAEALTSDHHVTDPTKLSPMMQGVKTIRDQWAAEPMPPIALDNAIQATTLSRHGGQEGWHIDNPDKKSMQAIPLRRSFVKPVVSAVKRLVLVTASLMQSLLGFTTRLLKMAVFAFMVCLSVSSRWVSRVFGASMPWAVALGNATASRTVAAAKIAFHSTTRFARNLKTIYTGAAIGLFQITSSLAVQSYRGTIFCCSRINGALVAFAAWSSRAGKSTLGAMGAGVSHAGKGNPYVMQTIQRNLVAARSAFGHVTRLHMAGLAASGACLFLLMTSWSDVSTSKQPFVIMAFPPKPLPIPAKPSQHGPIAFEWPSFEKLPNAFARPSIADETPVALIAPEVREFLSPDEALNDLVETIAPSDAASKTSLAVTVPTPAIQAEEPFVKNRPSADARLVTLTLLADIEAIAGLGEFARVVRLVGLETLIEPGKPYTILVPSDAAFANLGQDRLEALQDPRGHNELRALLSNHILSERLKFSDFAGEIRSYQSLADQPITIAAADVIKVEDASMIETDLRAANTVIHVVDKILVLQDPWSRSSLRSSEGTERASDI